MSVEVCLPRVSSPPWILGGAPSPLLAGNQDLMLLIEPHHNNEGGRLHNEEDPFTRFQSLLSQISTYLRFLVVLLSFTLSTNA